MMISALLKRRDIHWRNAAISSVLFLAGCAQSYRTAAVQPQPAASNALLAANSENPEPASIADADDRQSDSASTRARRAAERANYSPLGAFDNFHEVEPGRAYRCAQVRPETLQYIVNNYCVRTVINLRGENDYQEWYQLERLACESLGVKLIDIRMTTYELPYPQTLLALFDALKSVEEPVLIHCKSGADRTGMACALWRMTALGEDQKTAAQQLSFVYGHFRSATPAMDQMVRMFVPDRRWIRKEYPKLRLAALETVESAKRSARDDD
jgi:protein tyrosine phosphatase (PTP) superfamily phosphohydrolase (DUF442 family)